MTFSFRPPTSILYPSFSSGNRTDSHEYIAFQIASSLTRKILPRSIELSFPNMPFLQIFYKIALLSPLFPQKYGEIHSFIIENIFMLNYINWQSLCLYIILYA